MVLHGGRNGQLKDYGLPNQYVLDWNSHELQTLISLGQGERMPTLEQVLDLCKTSPSLLLNIEIKAPENAVMYNHDLAAKKTVEMINKYDIGARTIVSSFSPRILEAVVRESNMPLERKFLIMPLVRP